MIGTLLSIIFAASRIGLGGYFASWGLEKLMAGEQAWLGWGQQMSNIGINVAPVAWGFAAMASELLGGLALMGGFKTRVASFFLTIVMVIVLTRHGVNHEGWEKIAKPVVFLSLLLIFFVVGGGKYSLDMFLKKA